MKVYVVTKDGSPPNYYTTVVAALTDKEQANRLADRLDGDVDPVILDEMPEEEA